MKHRLKLLHILWPVALTALACNLASEIMVPQTATLAATSTASPAPTNTAMPTATSTPSPSPTVTLAPTLTATPSPTPLPFSGPLQVTPLVHGHHSRPQLSGTSRFIDTQHFRIFFTLSGEDAVPIVDENGNAIPDYVEEVAIALEYVWQVEIEELGWSPPPPDRSIGGDERYDVYLLDLKQDSLQGYAAGGEDDEIIGDNPRTAAIEHHASFSFIGIENDFVESDELDAPLGPLQLMRITIAHELIHAIQFGYDSTEPNRWFWESTATWIENKVYTEIFRRDSYLLAAFKAPDTCQLASGGDTRVEDIGHWYSEWLFLEYVSQLYGREIVRQFWEVSIEENGYDVLEAVFADLGTSLDEIMIGYALAVLLRDFPEGQDYPIVRLEGIASAGERFIPNDGVGQMAADYVEIRANGLTDIDLGGSQQGTVVGIRNEEADVFPLLNGVASIDADRYDKLYLIVLNLDRAEDEDGCEKISYSVLVSSGEQSQAPVDTLSAPNFDRPRVEPLLDPDDFLDE